MGKKAKRNRKNKDDLSSYNNISKKKITKAIFIISVLSLLVFYIINVILTDKKYLFEDGIYQIEIIREDITRTIPGVAVIRENKERFFTTAHWFPKNIKKHFTLKLCGKTYSRFS